MGIINVLEPQVANLIAAGEVVDRPASVVKELLENAIDSGADSVTVEIRNGGIKLIRVSDNGCGMAREDVPVCIKRHATSKIHSERDLDSIVTLGFRGEALAAIGSVSTLRIITKQKNSSMGTALTCVSGEINSITETGAQNGTTVIVEDLFANIPARRKFLKKDSSEALACSAVVEKIALSRPDLSVKFVSDGNLRFSTSGDGKLLNAVYAVLGRDFAHRLTEVCGKTNGIGVTGYIGTPENVRANRNYQNFFINGRYVKSRTAMAALEQAFSSYIPSDKFPVCVLEIKIHPALVDVNVHPAKLEVKFSNEQAVFDAVYSAVLTTLENLSERPKFGLTGDKAKRDSKVIGAFVPLKESGNGADSEKSVQMTLKDFSLRGQAVSSAHLYGVNETELPPHLRFSQAKKDDIPLPLSVDNSIIDTITSSGSELIEADKMIKKVRLSVPETGITPQNTDECNNEKEEKSDPGNPEKPTENTELTYRAAEITETPHIPAESAAVKSGANEEEKNVSPEKSGLYYSDGEVGSANDTTLNKDGVQALSDPVNEPVIPEYRILGEIFNSYVLVETEGKLLMIDKHAAHERILFEDMRKNITGSAESQMLLVPLNVKLSEEESAAADEYGEKIKAMGYIYDISDGECKVSGIPSGLSADEAETLLVTVLGKLADGTGNVSVTGKLFFEQALYQASCKAAIKAGRIYGESHIKWICDRLLSDESIMFCPHGRPVAFEISQDEIEHRFKRK